jgi:photosystem II stability/assembly factor-like uncharacterized protein
MLVGAGAALGFRAGPTPAAPCTAADGARSSDAPWDWTALPAGMNPSYDLDMTDVDHGWALVSDSELIVTTDGGRSWRDVTPPRLAVPSPPHLTTPLTWTAIDPLHAWVVTARAVDRTDDGGRTWCSVPSPASADGVQFVSDTTGYLWVGSEQPLGLWTTTDGGAEWTRVPLVAPQTPYPPYLAMVGWRDADTGWAVAQTGVSSGMVGALYVTHDGGITWSEVTARFPDGLPDGPAPAPMRWFGSRDGCMVMSSGTGGGSPVTSGAYVTDDGGTRWMAVPPPSTSPALLSSQRGLACAGPDVLTAVLSDGTVETTSDGGRDWSEVGRQPSLASVVSMDFVNTDHGYLVTDPSEFPPFNFWAPEVVYATSNGGRALAQILP